MTTNKQSITERIVARLDAFNQCLEAMKLWFLKQNGHQMSDPDVVSYSSLRK